MESIIKTKYFIYLGLFFILIFAIFFINSCGNSENPPGSNPSNSNHNITVSWQPNKETLVNTSGGGYKVYYCQRSGFNLTDTDVYVQDVPYISDTQAPTSTTLQLSSGQWYIKLVAYFSSYGGSFSTPSIEKSITVP